APLSVAAVAGGPSDTVFLLVTGDGLKTLGPVSFTYAPIAIAPDADAFLEEALAAGSGRVRSGAMPGAVSVTRDQVGAYRLARHHLVRRAPRDAVVMVLESMAGAQAQL